MNMKKTLIYHLYCGEDFETNIANKVHYVCLTKYIEVFDDVRFTISVDDLSNTELISKGIEWVLSLGGSFERRFTVVKNTPLYEVETFKREFLDNYENLDGMVFFAHNKGTTNMYGGALDGNSIFNWVCGMYYFNFEFISEVEGYFDGTLRAPEVFYGTFLLYFSKERQCMVHAMPNNLSGLEYSGTFYWINIPKYKNCVTTGIVQKMEPDSRFFAEEYPGMFFDRYAYGAGMTSHKDVCLDAMVVDLYHMDEEQWENMYVIMGEYDGFKDFLTEIKTLVCNL